MGYLHAGRGTLRGCSLLRQSGQKDVSFLSYLFYPNDINYIYTGPETGGQASNGIHKRALCGQMSE